jgi:uncharacterized protein (DUF433 family)
MTGAQKLELLISVRVKQTLVGPRHDGVQLVPTTRLQSAGFGALDSRRHCRSAPPLRQWAIETAMSNFERITVDPAQMGGVPCVRQLRIPVATVLRLLAGGLSEHEILAEYPDLQIEDIRECLRFAASSVMERELPLPRSA